MGMEKLQYHDNLLKRRTVEVWDDFNVYVSTDLWTTVASGGTAAAGDGDGGVLTLTGDTTGNHYVYAKTTNKIFTIKAGAALVVEAMVQFAEADTNKMCLAFGVSSAVAAGQIADTTGEPVTSFSGAVIYKVTGSTVWKTCSSLSTTQTKNVSTLTAGGAAYHRLKIVIEPVSATVAEVTYYVDDVQLQTAGGRPGQALIKDQLTYTGAAAMNFFVGLKQISTNTAEVCLVDYMAAEYLARPLAA